MLLSLLLPCVHAHLHTYTCGYMHNHVHHSCWNVHRSISNNLWGKDKNYKWHNQELLSRYDTGMTDDWISYSFSWKSQNTFWLLTFNEIKQEIYGILCIWKSNGKWSCIHCNKCFIRAEAEFFHIGNLNWVLKDWENYRIVQR